MNELKQRNSNLIHRFNKILNPGVFSLFFTSIIAFLLQLVPLTNTLDYEFSAVIGFWLFISGGFLFLSMSTKSNSSILQFIRLNWINIASLIIIPFLIGAFNSLFFKICPFRQGIQFYIFISVFSLFLGILTANLASVISFNHNKLLFLLFIAGCIFTSLLDIYLFPQVFTYNILIGYFPGTIYDELIEFNQELIIFRFYTAILIICFTLLVLFFKKKTDKKFSFIKNSRILQFIWTLSFTSIFFALYFFMNLFFGFSISLSTIKSKIGGIAETEHFTLIYPKEISPEKVTISALHHEFYYTEISKKLNVQKSKKIVSLLFSSPEQKKKYIGSANADISKPWQNIVITDFNNHDRTLKHEISHAFSASFGTTVFKISDNSNPLILEGFASAIENKFDIWDLNYAAGMIKDYKSSLRIGSLYEGLNFFGQNSAVSYAYSGAFVKYLIEKYGVEVFKKVYADTDFTKYYGKNVQYLEKEFEEFISQNKYSFNKSTEILYFAGKPIFFKKCPRYAAYMVKMGNDYFYKKNYLKSLSYFTDVYNISETSTSLNGVINSLIKLNREKDALNFLESEIKKFYSTNSQFLLQLTLAELYIRNNMILKAIPLYTQVINDASHFDYVINAHIKMGIIGQGEVRIKEYIEGDLNSRIKIISSCNGLGKLYKAFWYSNAGKSGEVPFAELYNFVEQYIPQNELELYLLFNIYSYLKDKGEFSKANRILKSCIKYNSKSYGFSEIIEENRKKIDYLIKFKDIIFSKTSANNGYPNSK